ncbi:GDP-L-fucose synthase [compost metagenome]
MKVLIVGSSSSIGYSIGKSLEHQGHVKFAGRENADFFFDLTFWDTQPTVNESFDVVVHVAADFGGTATEDFIRAELVNAVGTLSVCRLAEACHARHLILISSISATYQLGDPYYGIYALSKKHAEEAALLFCSERALALTVLRPSQVYDAQGKCRRHQPLLYGMADKAQAGENIYLYGTHDPLRNYLYLEDLAEICSRVVETRVTGVFDCVHPLNPRLSEVAEAAFAAFANGGEVQFHADKPNLLDLPLVTSSLLYEEIGFYPLVDIKQGFERIRQFRGREL